MSKRVKFVGCKKDFEMIFSQIVGHKDLIENLKGMIDNDRIPHALLFSERAGCGAIPLALATIQYLFCKTRRAVQGGDNTWELKGLFGEDERSVPKDDSCEVCSSCIKIRNLQHPDLHFVFPINTTQLVEKGKKTTIDSYYDIFRKTIVKNPYFSEDDLYKEMGLENKMGLIGVNEANWIINKLSFAAYEGGCRVVLLLFPERMNAEAANKLLKNIEEPSEKTYFFMVTNNPDKIIKTIRSRCRLIEVPPIEKESLAENLVATFKINEDEAQMWANCSQGSMGNAIRLIQESEEDGVYFEDFSTLFSLCKKRRLPELLDKANELAGRGKEEQKMFCISSLRLLREAYIAKLQTPKISYLSPKEIAFIEELGASLDFDFFRKGYDLFNETIDCIERNVSAKIAFVNLCNRLYISVL